MKMCRACTKTTDAAGMMMLFLALACTIASRTVAEAYPTAEGPIFKIPEYFDLQANDLELEVEEADKFTDLPISIFQRIFLSRANSTTPNAACHAYHAFPYILI
jgi:hypothetical protein